MRSFEFARKMENGAPVITPDERGVEGEVKAFPEAKLPEYSTRKSAGADFFAAEEVVVPSIWKQVAKSLLTRGIHLEVASDVGNDKKKFKIVPTFIHTGIKASMEDDEVLELYNRSSNPKKLGLVLANSVGVIDADYYGNPDNDGEMMFAYYNFSPWDVTIKVGDKIGQGVFKKFLRPEVGLVIKDQDRVGGFGSTGK